MEKTAKKLKPSRPSRRKAVSACVAGVLLTIATNVVSAAVPTYTTFQMQARSNLLQNDNGYNLPPGSSFNSITPSINNRAQVAFTVGVVPDAMSSHPGVWLGAAGVGALVYQGPTDASINSEASLNASGSIAFTLSDTGDSDGIYIYRSDLATASRLDTFPVVPNSYGTPTININSYTGYQANFSSGRAYASTGNGSSVFHITDIGLVPSSPYTYLYTPAFNDLRRIAAKVSTSPDFTTKVEIRTFASDGSSMLILANQATNAASPYSKFDNGLAVNNHDVIAVVATRAADNRRVVVRSDGITTVEIAAVDPVGQIREIDFFAPAINDDGLVAFRGKELSGQAIYVGNGTTLVRVVGNGDVIQTDLGTAQLGQNNSTDPVFSGKPAINARGEVAFIAGLYPQGNNQIEWGSGVFIAYGDSIFNGSFDNAPN